MIESRGPLKMFSKSPTKSDDSMSGSIIKSKASIQKRRALIDSTITRFIDTVIHFYSWPYPVSNKTKKPTTIFPTFCHQTHFRLHHHRHNFIHQTKAHSSWA